MLLNTNIFSQVFTLAEDLGADDPGSTQTQHVLK